jgi:hypothetical protein
MASIFFISLPTHVSDEWHPRPGPGYSIVTPALQ